MSSYQELVSILKEILINRFYPKPEFIKGLLGDGLGNVLVPGRPDYNFARFNRSASETFEVFNKEVSQPVDGTPVLIGSLPWQPGLVQVVGIDWEAYLQTGWGDTYASIQAHASTHEWPDFTPGSDYMRVFLRSIFPLQGYGDGGTGSMTFTAYPYQYDYTGTNSYWPGTPTVSLGPTRPPTGTMRYMGVYLNPATNALGVVTGSSVTFGENTEPPYPAWPLNVYPISYARVYGGQAYFTERDIKDARRLWNTTLMFTGTSAGGGGGTAASQATVDAGTNTTEFVNPSTLASASTVSRVANIFINGAFDVWQRTTNDTGVTTALKYVSDRWYVITAAGTLANVQRSTTVRTGALSKYSLEMVGAAGVTVVNIGQRIESMYSARYKRTLAFSCYIFNGSGAAFTPILYAITPNAVDNFTGTVIRNGGGSGESLQSCADNAWTKVTWSADVSGYTNIDNGLGITLEIPSGSLVASDTVRFAEMNLVPGTAFNPIEPSDPVQELSKCMRYAWVIPPESGNNQGQGVKASTTLLGVQLRHPVPMRTTPTLSHNITGYTAGVPGTTTIGCVDYVRGVFYAITGALTVTMGAAGIDYSNLFFTAGTSWDGTVGNLTTLRVGPGVVMILSAEL